MKKIPIAILIVLGLVSALILAAKSPWGQNYAKNLLSDALKKSGFEVQIDQITGTLPSRIDLRGVAVRGQGLEITAEKVEAELSLLRLFRKELAFTQLTGDQITWKQTGPAPSKEPLGETSALSFPVYVQHYKLTNVQIPDLFSVNLEGRLRLGQKTRFFTLKAVRPEFPASSLSANLLVQIDGTAQLRGTVKSPTLEAFNIAGAPDTSFNIAFSAMGPWKSMLKDQTNLQGRIRGTATPRTLPIPDPFGKWLEREWGFSARFKRDASGNLTLSNLLAKSDLFQTKGKASLDPSYRLVNASLQTESDHFLSTLPYNLTGSFFAALDIAALPDAVQTKTTVQIPSLNYQNIRFDGVKGTIDAAWAHSELKGIAQLSGSYKTENWEAKSDFSWAEDAPLFLPNAHLTGPHVAGDGQLEIRPDQIVLGTANATVDSLQSFHLPEVYGNAELKSVWSATDSEGIQVQAVHLDASSNDFYYGPFHTLQGTLSMDLTDWKQGAVRIDLGQSRWGDLQLQSAHFETANDGENWPYILAAEGKWKHPLILSSRGFWNYKDQNFYAEVLDLSGTFYNHPFLLTDPVVFEFGPKLFTLSDTTLTVGASTLFASLLRKDGQTDARLQMNRVPLDFLSLNPLEAPIEGILTLNASLSEKGGKTKGDLTASIENMEVASREKLSASGAIQAHLERDRLDITADIASRSAPLFNLNASLPVHLSLQPLEAELSFDKSSRGRIVLNGKIQDFLDFFDLGTHRLEGDAVCDLKWSNNLQRPLLEGTCHFENGSYVNYYTGTRLKNIQADFLADKQTLYLRSLKGDDGNFSALGEIQAKPEEKFPFRFDLTFNQFNFVEIDLVTASANGKVQIKGNLESALAKGEILIAESQMSIPDHIPKPLPNLQVVYKNQTQPIAEPAQKFPSYPLHLDLHVTAPETVFITGRGLNSQWTGDFQVGGTYSSVAAKGKLELIQGEFSFSTRTFKLSEGSLTLTGKEREMPYLNLTGSLDQRGISIIARLKGPLNSPQVTLQSAPPLPLSSIMSYLLFGQDISEISGFQALQLATSIAGMAGQGPDILESTRRSLGLDRLRIIAAPGSAPESETVAIEAGKYIAEGVLVSFSQGAEDSSTNASIEVELKDNFVFQAESVQQEEQGKFTIKWSLNY